MAYKVKLDRSGMAQMLDSSEVQSVARQAAETIAERARAHPSVQRYGTPVVIYSYMARGGRLASPRTAFSVSLAHARGLNTEAKYGVLNRAAAEGDAV